MRTRLMRTTLRASIFMALFSVAAGSAFGEPPTPGVLYRVVAGHSGKCLTVSGGPDAVGNGALVVQWDCSNAQNQLWLFDSVDGANVYRITAKHSGKVLDVFGGVFSGADQVIVEQWDWNRSQNQMWKLNPVGDGYYAIIAMHSAKALDVRGASYDNGAQAQQYTFGYGTNQEWKLVPFTPCP